MKDTTKFISFLLLVFSLCTEATHGSEYSYTAVYMLKITLLPRTFSNPKVVTVLYRISFRLRFCKKYVIQDKIRYKIMEWERPAVVHLNYDIEVCDLHNCRAP